MAAVTASPSWLTRVRSVVWSATWPSSGSVGYCFTFRAAPWGLPTYL